MPAPRSFRLPARLAPWSLLLLLADVVVLPLALPACDDDGRAPLVRAPDAAHFEGPAARNPPSEREPADARVAFVPDDAGVRAPGERADPSSFGCPEVPTAYVFDFADPFTGVEGAADLLQAAGFTVAPLPLDQDPTTLRGLIFFASFASESADYRAYVKANAAKLYTFVDKGNVLFQGTQADQTEAVAPFLPAAYMARRSDLDVPRLKVLDPAYPLLEGVPTKDGYLAWEGSIIGWETFVAQGGFETVLAQTDGGNNAALLEAAYGQGRIVLSAIAFDKPLGKAHKMVPYSNPIGPPEERDAFNHAFFANLYQHVNNVCRRQTRALNIAPSATQPAFSAGSFMLAVMPDTQFYAQLFPGIYDAQVSWIVANAQRRRIAYVLHLGDIVNNNTPSEWQHAYQSMSLLDGVVPYALTTGNHDYGPSGDASTRDTLLNDYFPFAKQAAMPTFGGAYENGRLENTYHLFAAGGRDYIVLALEWGPREEVIAWARGVMDRYPDRYGILVTHAYMNNDDRRYDFTDKDHAQDFNPHGYGTPGGVTDGEELWQKLVRHYRFVFTLNGHVLGDGTGYLASVTDRGNTCHQILSNYQFRNLGGEGYMRLMEFLPDGQTVRVFTYSPLYDSFLVEADQNFSVTLDIPPPRATP